MLGIDEQNLTVPCALTLLRCADKELPRPLEGMLIEVLNNLLLTMLCESGGWNVERLGGACPIDLHQFARKRLEEVSHLALSRLRHGRLELDQRAILQNEIDEQRYEDRQQADPEYALPEEFLDPRHLSAESSRA